MKILIKNVTLISMNKNEEQIQENMDILINEKKIEKIEKNIEIDKNEKELKIIDATGKVAMPGLINTHAHVPMSIFRETLDGYNLQDWLNKKIWPMEAKLTNEDIYYASLLSFVEMIKTGCTTINDMYFMTDDIIDAEKKTGIRLQTTRCLMGDGDKEEDLNRLNELTQLVEKYKDLDTVSFNAGIHGLYTSNRKYVQACAEYARKNGMPVHIHFCENSGEVKDIINGYGESPVQILSEEFKNLKVILAHCVKLDDEDISNISKINKESYLIKDANGKITDKNPIEENGMRISVATCPVSNLKLGCGIAKINAMNKAGINVSIGTDGQGSGSNLDLFESMKYVALLQKGIDENPEEMPAYEVLKMATINGAKALGLEDKIGSIEEGKCADIIIIDMDSIITKPTNHLISEIIYNVKGSDVNTTIVNGKILMENRKLNEINEKEVYEQAEKIIDRIKE
jgi:5-methylthioadenosine/S-adenosylhomocysteine deaminase